MLLFFVQRIFCKSPCRQDKIKNKSRDYLNKNQEKRREDLDGYIRGSIGHLTGKHI